MGVSPRMLAGLSLLSPQEPVPRVVVSSREDTSELPGDHHHSHIAETFVWAPTQVGIHF